MYRAFTQASFKSWACLIIFISILSSSHGFDQVFLRKPALAGNPFSRTGYSRDLIQYQHEIRHYDLTRRRGLHRQGSSTLRSLPTAATNAVSATLFETVIPTVTSLSLLAFVVLIHELGHFTLAVSQGIKVSGENHPRRRVGCRHESDIAHRFAPPSSLQNSL